MEKTIESIRKDLEKLNARINYVNKHYSDQTFMIELYQARINTLEKKLEKAMEKNRELVYA